MIATHPKLTLKNDWIELSARVKSERFPFRTERIWWRFPSNCHEHLKMSGDPLLAALLLPCMFRGERLVIEAPVSKQLLDSAIKIQDLISDWFTETKKIPLEASPAKDEFQPGPSVGCFFSGGVDSFYSLLKNRPSSAYGNSEITHLLLINGFDIKLKYRDLYQRLRKHISMTAGAMDKSLLEVSTNLKIFGDRILPWAYYHGSVLASVGLALGSMFNKLIIPSTFTTNHLFPFGSHPDFDPLWSTEITEFEHDGCETNRSDKILHCLFRSELFLDHLHVCWRNRNVHYNCGVCEKCIRTMIPLYLGTGRTEFPSFSQPLSPNNIYGIKLKESSLEFVYENLKGLENRHSEFDRQLKEALTDVVNQFQYENATKNKILSGGL